MGSMMVSFSILLLLTYSVNITTAATNTSTSVGTTMLDEIFDYNPPPTHCLGPQNGGRQAKGSLVGGCCSFVSHANWCCCKNDRNFLDITA